MIRTWLGDPVSERSFYERVQAITYASRIKIPTLLIHGQHDMLSPPEQSVMMRDAINANGKESAELLLVPYMGHYGDVVPNGYAFNFLSTKIHEFLERVWRTD
jgi:dipeptidyl aminopeptidase/acylaminoacyl peptidase